METKQEPLKIELNITAELIDSPIALSCEIEKLNRALRRIGGQLLIEEKGKMGNPVLSELLSASAALDRVSAMLAPPRIQAPGAPMMPIAPRAN